MAKPKNPKNKHSQIADNIPKGTLAPPLADSGTVKGPSKFDTIGDVIREQQRLYKMVFKGELAIGDLTKLMYALQQIITGMKAKSEMDQLEDAYSKQWQGVRIIAPPGEDVPKDPFDAAIESGGELVDE